MIWYHLYNNGEGLRAGFLRIADDFDGASDAADELVAKGRVEHSVWILTREELMDLIDSINQEIGRKDIQNAEKVCEERKQPSVTGADDARA